MVSIRSFRDCWQGKCRSSFDSLGPVLGVPPSPCAADIRGHTAPCTHEDCDQRPARCSPLSRERPYRERLAERHASQCVATVVPPPGTTKHVCSLNRAHGQGSSLVPLSQGTDRLHEQPRGQGLYVHCPYHAALCPKRTMVDGKDLQRQTTAPRWGVCQQRDRRRNLAVDPEPHRNSTSHLLPELRRPALKMLSCLTAIHSPHLCGSRGASRRPRVQGTRTPLHRCRLTRLGRRHQPVESLPMRSSKPRAKCCDTVASD
mmetsp:Transcript_61254/g.162837  ORF Transcript_61254/g.162837 Transcript_61254/m.162837 type:complete len:259 (+) Transcript_61254:177-953(+)